MSIKLSDNITSIRVPETRYKDLNMLFVPKTGTKDIAPSVGVDAIKQSVKNLVLANKWERPFHPELATNVTVLLFENADRFTAIAMKTSIENILSNFEPRIDTIRVQVYDDSDRNRYQITVGFRIKESSLSTEVSFYLKRTR